MCAVLKGGTTVWGMGHFPLGEGSIRAEEEETVVDVKMRFPWQMYLLFPVLFGMGGYAIWDARAFPVVCKLILLFTCGFEFLSWVYVRIEFYFEARRARENMEDLLGEKRWTHDEAVPLFFSVLKFLAVLAGRNLVVGAEGLAEIMVVSIPQPFCDVDDLVILIF